MSQETNSRILIIDDDQKLCRLVKDYLAPFGFTVEAAHTGPEGLEKVKNSDIQAVILDVMLPGMDGFTVLKEIRQTSNVPVLMLTALGDESDRIVGLEIGADDYLPKTFPPANCWRGCARSRGVRKFLRRKRQAIPKK
jgi:DNA-binding response OmpR family regulator